MSADPSLSAVTLPPGAAAKIAGSALLQAASFVTSTVVPLLIVAIAVNCAVSPTTIRLFGGPTIFSDIALPAGAAVTAGDADEGEDGDEEPHASATHVKSAATVMMTARRMRTSIAALAKCRAHATGTGVRIL